MPVGTANAVGDQDVRVQVRVAVAARAMPERRGDQPVGADLYHAVVASSRPHRVTLEVVERGVDRILVGCGDDASDARVGQAVEHRHGLRCPEREVEAGDLAVRCRAEPCPGSRVAVGEDWRRSSGDTVPSSPRRAVELAAQRPGSSPRT